jgi:hypothetical protein
MEKTYKGWQEWSEKSLQTEYTEPAPLLAPDGTLLAKGWARKNLFQYDRNAVKHPLRRKEWDFYQISNGYLMVQLSFANISLGGYASLVVVDLHRKKRSFPVWLRSSEVKTGMFFPPAGIRRTRSPSESAGLFLRPSRKRRNAPFILKTGTYAAISRWISCPVRKTSLLCFPSIRRRTAFS